MSLDIDKVLEKRKFFRSSAMFMGHPVCTVCHVRVRVGKCLLRATLSPLFTTCCIISSMLSWSSYRFGCCPDLLLFCCISII